VAAIVYAAAPGSRAGEAVRMLQDALEDICGLRAPAWREDEVEALPPGVVVLVGPSRFTRDVVDADGLPPQTCRILSRPGRLYLVGAPPATETVARARGAGWRERHYMLEDEYSDGTLYAVTWFMKQWLGVDHLFPGGLGRVFPLSERVEIPLGLDETFTPKTVFRRLRNNRSGRGRDAEGLAKLGLDPGAVRDEEPLGRDWFRRHCLGFSADLRFTHNFTGWWERYGKDHPDWFAQQANGSRDQSAENPDRVRFCKSNPGFIRHVADTIKAHFRAHPSAQSYSISLNDGGCHMGFCECDACQALDPAEAPKVKYGGRERPSLTDRIFTFYSRVAEQVAEEFPEKLLGAYAYSAYRQPPVRMASLPPNLLIGLVALQYENDDRRQEGRREIAAWSKLCRNLFLRPNALWAFRGFPAFFARRLAEDARWAIDQGCIGFDWDCNIGHWAASGVNVWILAQVMWNPAQEVDELLERYCRLGFGRGWQAVRDYFLHVEALSEGYARSNRWIEWTHSMGDLASIYTEEWISGSMDLLARADSMEPDPVIRRRVDFLRTALKVTRLRRDYFVSVFEQDADAGAQRGIETEHLDGQTVQVFRARDPEICRRREELYRSLVNSFAFNIGSLNWRNL